MGLVELGPYALIAVATWWLLLCLPMKEGEKALGWEVLHCHICCIGSTAQGFAGGGFFGIAVEVPEEQAVRPISALRHQAIDLLSKASAAVAAVASRGQCSATARREVTDEDVECVARGDLARDTKQGARSAQRIKGEVNRDLLGSDEVEGLGGIEERYIDAALILSVRDDMAVACLLPEGGAMEEVAEHSGILYLHEGDEVGEGFSPDGTDDLSDMLDLRLVACMCPVVLSSGKEAVIVVGGIIFGIEEVLHVVAHYAN